MNKIPMISGDNLLSLFATLKGYSISDQINFFTKLAERQPGLWEFISAIILLAEDGKLSEEFVNGMIKGISLTVQSLERQIEADELNRQWGL